MWTTAERHVSMASQVIVCFPRPIRKYVLESTESYIRVVSFQFKCFTQLLFPKLLKTVTALFNLKQKVFYILLPTTSEEVI